MATIDLKSEFHDGIIGLPPRNLTTETDQIIRNSMPIASITPAVPTFTSGQTIFTLKSANTDYKKLLADHGFSYEPPIKVAFLADNFPTDTFTNEYSESFLNKLTDVVSSGMAEINQFFGSTDARVTGERIAGAMASQKGMMGTLGGAAQTGIEELKGMGKAIGKVSPRGASMVNMVSKLAAGGRIDFPMIWKNSGYQPSYTMTVRLYNPNPMSDMATTKFIIGPLAALLLLGLPRSVDNNTYNWPFLQKIKCEGLYFLNSAYMSNITVVKGGDQQQIAHNQRLGIVDVRMEFGSLYSSITVGKENPSRPTLKSYLKALTGKDLVFDYDAKKYQTEEQARGEETGGGGGFLSNIPGLPGQSVAGVVSMVSRDSSKLLPRLDVSSIRKSQAYQDLESQAKDRVTDEAKNIFNDLKKKSPF